MKKARKNTTGGDPVWKYKGDLHFDMDSVGQQLRVPGKEQQGW